MTSASALVLGLALLAWILLRQTRVREVEADRRPWTLLVLGAVGLVEVLQALGAQPVRAAAAGFVLGSLLIAAGFGVLRGRLQRVWRAADGRTLQRGTVVTVGLWLLATALHFGADRYATHLDAAAAGLASTSLMLYLVVSLGVQRVVVARRATRSLVVGAGDPASVAEGR